MNLLLALLSPIFVYVANQASGKVTVIDAATDSVVAIVDFDEATVAQQAGLRSEAIRRWLFPGQDTV